MHSLAVVPSTLARNRSEDGVWLLGFGGWLRGQVRTVGLAEVLAPPGRQLLFRALSSFARSPSARWDRLLHRTPRQYTPSNSRLHTRGALNHPSSKAPRAPRAPARPPARTWPTPLRVHTTLTQLTAHTALTQLPGNLQGALVARPLGGAWGVAVKEKALVSAFPSQSCSGE